MSVHPSNNDYSAAHSLCWAPDEQEVYRLVKIIREDTNGGKYQVAHYSLASLSAAEKTVTISSAGTYPVHNLDELSSPPSDLIQLYEVHPPGILHALRTRFAHNLIYTSIGPILVSINPFKAIPGLYEDSVMQKYADGEMNLADNPHLFAMAHDAHIGLQMGKNQSLVISGESGAGKTEATKHCLNYFASVAGSSLGLQDKVLQASPILEAWGNAKTIRNNNSSRFGKFIEIWFGESYDIQGSLNTTYLLEKSRVVMQDRDERNYHIFYMLLFGASEALKRDLVLDDLAKNPESVTYINQSGCMSIAGVDERKDFAALDHAMKVMGFSEDDVMTLFRTVAAILHMGNIKFEADPNEPDTCQFSQKSIAHHLTASELLGLDPISFKMALLYKVVRSGNRKSFVHVPFDLPSALENRNALAKELYSRCFDWVVKTINSRLKYQSNQQPAGGMIGILDIFGFEVFKKNSFEQLCINLANEALQQHFNMNIFEHEMEIYASEGIKIPPLVYSDNADVLDLLSKKPKGLIPMLNEEGQIPRGTVDGFFNKFTRENASHPRLKFKPGSKEFCIMHYAGEVRYDPVFFLVKNKDTLSSDMVEIMAQSSIPLLSELFEEPPEMAMSSPMKFRDSSTMANKQTVGSRFKQQLDTLIARLTSTEPKYVRCIKPNNDKKPNVLEPILTNEQMRYTGIFEAVVIMQNGFPFRLTHSEFSSRYHMLALKAKVWNAMFKQNNGLGSPFREQSLCTAIVQAAAGHFDECLSNCHIGKTMVFYRAEQNRLLERLRKAIWSHNRVIVQKHSRGFVIKKLLRRMVNYRAATSKNLISGDLRSVKSSKDILRSTCTIFAKITGVHLYEDFLSLSDLYCSTYELLRSVEQSLKDILSYREHRLGMLPHFDNLKAEIEKSKQIYFNEEFEGSRIIIQWNQSSIILDAVKEYDRLSVIREIKVNLQSGITANDELHLLEWMEKMSSYRVSGLVFGSYCADEERRASEIIEIASRQFKDFVSNVTAPIADGCFTYAITEDGFDGFDIQYSVNPKALVSYVERNHKMNLLSNVAMKVRMSLELCEKLCDLRLIASEEPIDWHHLWEALQPWKLYFSEATKVSLMKRRGSLISPQDAVTGSRRRGSVVVKHIMPDATADKVAGAIPFVPELVMHISNEIQGMAACCLEAILFKQMQNEIKSCSVPKNVTYGDLYVPLDSINRILTVLQDQTSCFTSSQLVRYNDARARYGLRKGVCSRSATELALAIEAAEGLLPQRDTELMDAKAFYDFYSNEDNLRTALRECGPSGTPGDLNFGDIDTKSISDALKRCSELLAADQGSSNNKNSWTEWKKLITACSAVNEVRGLLRDRRYLDAIALIDRFLFLEPFVHINNNLQLELGPSRGELKSYLSAVVNTFRSSPTDLLAPVDASLLPRCLFFAFDEERYSDPSHPGSEAVHRAVFELNRYKEEIKHNFAIEKVDQTLLQGSLIGAVGELDTSQASGEYILETILNSSDQFVVSYKTINALKSYCGIYYLRSCARISDWQGILHFFKLASHFIDPSIEVQTKFANLNSIFYESTRKEYRLYFEEAMDLQTRLRLVASFSEGRIVFDPVTGDCNVDAISTDTLAAAIEFAENREEKSTESVYLLNSAKLLFCLRCRVKAHIWEAIDSDFIFNCPLIMNGPSDDLLSRMAHKLTEMKAKFSIADFDDGVIDRLRTLFLAWNRFQMNEYGLTGAAVNKAEYIESILNTSIESLIHFAEYSSGSYDRANASDLIGFALSNGFHESISEEIHSVSRSYQERIAKRCLLLSSVINCIQVRMNELDTSSVAVDKLSKSVELMWFYMQTNSFSESAHKFYKISSFLLNMRLAVCSISEGVDVLTYFKEDALLSILAHLDEVPFPKAELTVVIEHIIDAMNVRSIMDALMHGSPRIYFGKFDIKNLAFDHIVCHLRTAKKLSFPSDRLERLMIYADLCVKLRKALQHQSWKPCDIKDSETSIDESSALDASVSQVHSVQRCLHNFSSAALYFQRNIPGVPPQSLIEEFDLVKTELERRNILEGFHLAFQSGKFGGTAGCLELGNVDYSKLTEQIEAAKKWSSSSAIKDSELIQLIIAAEEVIAIRKSLLDIHASYRSRGILAIDEFVESSSRSNKSKLSNIIGGCFFIDNAINSALTSVERLVRGPIPFEEEWRDVERHLAQIEASSRLSFFRVQLDTLVLETFERGLISRILKVFRDLQSLSGFGSAEEKTFSVARSLRGLCKSYFLKRSELAKASHSSNKLSEKSNFVYYSAVVLILLYEADMDISKWSYTRNWLKDFDGAGPSIYEMELLVVDVNRSRRIPIHEVISALRRQSLGLHPAVMAEVARCVRIIEDRVSEIELSDFLKQLSDRVTKGDFDIDSLDGHSVLLRVQELSAACLKHPNYAIEMIGSDSVSSLFQKPIPSYLRFHRELTPESLAFIDMTVGWQEVAAGKLVGSYINIEAFINAFKSHSELTKYALHYLGHSPKVVQLYYSSLILYKLHRFVKNKAIVDAFDVLRLEVAGCGMKPADTFKFISKLEYSLHPLAMPEFARIASIVCDQYWCQVALASLLSGAVTGSRGRLNLFSISWESIDEVIEMLNGFSTLSKNTELLRDLCVVVRYMRYSSLPDGVPLRAAADRGSQDFTGRVDNDSSLDDSGHSIVDECISNALSVVASLAANAVGPTESLTKAAEVSLAAAERVKFCLNKLSSEVVSIEFSSKLRTESDLVSEHSRFILAANSLERAFGMEGIWFSYSSSNLEISIESFRMLLEAAQGTANLRLMHWRGAEMKSALLHVAVVRILAVMHSFFKITDQADFELSSACKTFLKKQLGVQVERSQLSQLIRSALNCLEDLSHIYGDSGIDLVRIIGNYKFAFEAALEENGKLNTLLAIIKGSLEPNKSDGFQLESLMDASTAPLGPSDRMASFRGDIMWRLAGLHVLLRRAVKSKEWTKVEPLANAILLSDVFNLKSEGAEEARHMCKCVKIQRTLEMAISRCIFPQFIGWTQFESFDSVLRSICEYPLKVAVHACMEYSRKRSEEGFENPFQKFPIIPELLTIAKVLIDLVNNLRCGRFKSSQSIIGNQQSNPFRENSTWNASSDAISPDLAIIGLDQDMSAASRFYHYYDSVDGSARLLSDIITRSSILNVDYGVGLAVAIVVENIKAELQFGDLIAEVKAVVSDQKIEIDATTLLPPPDYYASMKKYLYQKDASFGFQNYLPKCAVLRRYYQSCKLLVSTWDVLSNGSGACNLDDVMKVYEYAVALPWTDLGEANRIAYMQSENIDPNVLMEMSESDFTENITARAASCQELQLTQFIRPKDFSEQLEQSSVKILMCPLEFVVALLPEVVSLLNPVRLLHYVKCANELFDLELADPKCAGGIAGDLDASCIETARLSQIESLLIRAGVREESDPALYLLRAASSMKEIRELQKSTFYFERSNFFQNESQIDNFVSLSAAVDKAERYLQLEIEFCDSHSNSVHPIRAQYLSRLIDELKIGRSDVLQREMIFSLCAALTADKISVLDSEDDIGCFDLTNSPIFLNVSYDQLASTLEKCEKLEKSNFSRRVSILYRLAETMQRIRAMFLSQAWDKIIDLWSSVDLSSVAVYPDAEFYLSFAKEFEDAYRIALTLRAFELTDYALSSGTLREFEIGAVLSGKLNLLSVTKSQQLIAKIPEKWVTGGVHVRSSSLCLAFQMRTLAINAQWELLYDCCVINLHEDLRSVIRIKECTRLELEAAKSQAAYYLSEAILSSALSTPWRLKGIVGFVDETCLSVQVVRDAIAKVDQLGAAENDYINMLQTSARIIDDLRSAQMRGAWVRSAHSNRGKFGNFQRSIEHDIVGSNFPTFNEESQPDLHDESSSVSKANISNLPRFNWCIMNSHLDKDFAVAMFEPGGCEDNDVATCVADVLEGAGFIEEQIGIASEAIDEINFARDEMQYRKIVSLLIEILSTPLLGGEPGALEVKSPEEGSANEFNISLQEAIDIAESFPQVSLTNNAKWLLRDAKLLNKLVQARRKDDWDELQELLVEAADQNDSEALDLRNDPRVSILPSGLGIIESQSNRLVHQPICPSVWSQVLILKADLNFYLCLADFAAEMSSETQESPLEYGEDRQRVTKLMDILLRTRAASVIWPSAEFNRLIEAQELAIELRSRAYFDTESLPRDVAQKIRNISNICRTEGRFSYVDLVLPNANDYLLRSECKELIIKLDQALGSGAKYLMCPIGQIKEEDMELDVLGESVNACLLYRLDIVGTDEEQRLVRLGNLVHEMRRKASEKRWADVLSLIESEKELLSSRLSTSEEIARLEIEAKNFQAQSIIRNALCLGRFTNILELVKQISQHKVIRTSADDMNEDSDQPSSRKRRRASMTLKSRDSIINKRRDSVWKTIMAADVVAEDFPLEAGKEGLSVRGLEKLNNAINTGMAVLHKSDDTSRLLKAAVLIQSLRSAIYGGFWDEVENIVSDESQYRDHKIPVETVEEIKVAKAALYYRNCMASLSKSLIAGRVTGSPGKVNLSSIDCLLLQSAINQAKHLKIDADPGALAMLDIAANVCLLRDAAMAGRWIHQTVLDDSSEQAVEGADKKKLSTVSDLIVVLREKLATLPINWEDDIAIEIKVSASVGASIELKEEKSILYDNTLDWIVLQGRALVSVKQELDLLEENMKDKLRQDSIAFALETVPPALVAFRTGGMTGLSLNAIYRGQISSGDLYLVDALSQSLNAAKLIDGTITEDTEKLYRTAEVILSFRTAMRDVDTFTFKQLISRTQEMISAGLLSDRYGVMELNTYCSAAMTMNISRAEFMKSIRTGAMKGSIISPNLDSIELHSLDKWILTYGANNSEALSSLQSISKEASVLLALRKLCKTASWLELKTRIDALYASSNKPQYIVEEVEFMRLTADYDISVKTLVSELSRTYMPNNTENQLSYIRLRSADMERASKAASEILDFLSNKRLIQIGKIIERTESMSKRDPNEYQSFLTEENSNLALNCLCIQKVARLWAAMRTQCWRVEDLSVGRVHFLSSPQDKALERFFTVLQQQTSEQRIEDSGSPESFGAEISSNDAHSCSKVDFGTIFSNIRDRLEEMKLLEISSIEKREFSPSIVEALCLENWNGYPEFCSNQFNAVRDTLIDKVIHIRVIMACFHGRASQTEDGNISVDQIDVVLLKAALTGVREMTSWFSQHRVPFAFSSQTTSAIQCAKGLLNCREAVINKHYDTLLKELLRLKYVTQALSRNRLEFPVYFASEEADVEFRYLQMLACEQYSLQRTRAAVCHILSKRVVNISLIEDRLIKNLGSAEMIGISRDQTLTPKHEIILLLGASVKRAVLSCYSGNPERVDLERSACLFLASELSLEEEISLGLFEQLFDNLARGASASIAPVEEAENNISYIKTQLSPDKPDTPLNTPLQAIEKTLQILHQIYITFLNAPSTAPNFVIRSDIIDELKASAKELEQHYAIVVDPDPWLYIAVSFILVACEPSYNRHISGHFIHLVDVSVGEFLRDSGVKLSAHSPPITFFEHRGVVSCEEFHVLFTVATVSAFIRRLIRSKLSKDVVSDSTRKGNSDPDLISYLKLCVKAASKLMSRKAGAPAAELLRADGDRFAFQCDSLITCIDDEVSKMLSVDTRTKTVKSAVYKRRKQLSN